MEMPNDELENHSHSSETLSNIKDVS